MRKYYFFIVTFFFLISLNAESIEAESRRTVIMDHSIELEKLSENLDNLDDNTKIRLLKRIIRKGGNALLRIDKNGDKLFVNARDYGFELLAQQPLINSKQAVKAHERAGDDYKQLVKVIERYPNTETALTILKNLLKSPQAEDAYFLFSGFVESHPELPSLIPEISDQVICLPASEKQPSNQDFILPSKSDLVFKGPMFYPPPKIRTRHRPEEPIRALYPLDHFDFDSHGVTIADFRGLTRFEFSEPVRQYLYLTDVSLLNHLDNNIIGDLTVIDDEIIISSQRHSLLKKDSQKDLYVVELSRHKLVCFKRSQNLKLLPNKKRTYLWSPQWSLYDDKKTYNSSIVVQGSKGFTTGTSLAGLFNSELICLDIASGKVAWKKALASGQQELNYFGRYIREACSGLPLVTKKAIFVSSNFGTIHAINIKGRPIWTTRYNRVPTPKPIQYYAKVNPRLSRFRNQMPRLFDKNLFVSPSDSDSLICLDSATGRHLWGYPLTSAGRGEYPHFEYWAKVFWFVDKNGVTLIDRDKIVLLDSQTGEIINQRKLPRNRYYLGRPIFCKNLIVLASGNHLVALKNKTFELVHEIDMKTYEVTFDQANLYYDDTRLAIVSKVGELFLFDKEGPL